MSVWNLVFADRLAARFANRRNAIGDALISEGDNPGVAHLMQSLVSGQMSVDELRAIREHSPRFARLLCEGLNLCIADLNRMARAGQLTRAVIEKAMR